MLITKTRNNPRKRVIQESAQKCWWQKKQADGGRTSIVAWRELVNATSVLVFIHHFLRAHREELAHRNFACQLRWTTFHDEHLLGGNMKTKGATQRFVVVNVRWSGVGKNALEHQSTYSVYLKRCICIQTPKTHPEWKRKKSGNSSSVQIWLRVRHVENAISRPIKMPKQTSYRMCWRHNLQNSRTRPSHTFLLLDKKAQMRGTNFRCFKLGCHGKLGRRWVVRRIGEFRHRRTSVRARGRRGRHHGRRSRGRSTHKHRLFAEILLRRWIS